MDEKMEVSSVSGSPGAMPAAGGFMPLLVSSIVAGLAAGIEVREESSKSRFSAYCQFRQLMVWPSFWAVAARSLSK